MQLLCVITARAIWTIQTRDLNPKGRNIEAFLSWLGSRYKFEKYPTSTTADDAQSKGLVFSNGSFPCGPREDDNLYVDLTIFNDGLVATTRSSTKDADDFLFEALTLATAEFHLVFRPEMVTKRVYLSEVDVRLDKPLNSINPKLKAFSDRVSALQGNTPRIDFEFSHISFQADPSVQQLRPSAFQLDRRLNVPFSENRYYSAAPLQTAQHLELLQMFEEHILAE